MIRFARLRRFRKQSRGIYSIVFHDEQHGIRNFSTRRPTSHYRRIEWRLNQKIMFGKQRAFLAMFLKSSQDLLSLYEVMVLTIRASFYNVADVIRLYENSITVTTRP